MSDNVSSVAFEPAEALVIEPYFNIVIIFSLH